MVTWKVAVVVPAATVTVEGTVAADGLLLESDTTAPFAGAAELKVTVPVDEVPPVTEVGFRTTDETVAELTVKVAPCEPLYDPVMVTCVEAPTAAVATWNVAELAPAATVTLAGTVAAEVLLLESVTTAPVAGAGPFSVTVPVEKVPPSTLDGFNETAKMPGGLTVRDVPWVPLSVPEILTCVGALTADVVIANVALVAPAATVTLAGTVATDELLLLSGTTAPPGGAGEPSVTVPVEGVPPMIDAGLAFTDERAAAGAFTLIVVFCVPLCVPEIVT